MQPFLDEYIANGGTIINAARVADIHRNTVGRYLNDDPEFARAFKEADEVRNDNIRATLKRIYIDGWEEPVFGRVDRVVDGKVLCETVIVGHVTRHDNKLLMRMAEANLEEYAKTAGGQSVTVNTSASAIATAAAAVAVQSAPAKLKGLQARKNRQLTKAAARGKTVLVPSR